MSCRCEELDNHESLYDPWDDLETRSPAHRKKMEIIETLGRILGHRGMEETSFRSCPACGTWFYYHYGPDATGDHGALNVVRYTAEQTDLLRVLAESADEALVGAHLAEAFPHPNPDVRTGAYFLFATVFSADLNRRPEEIRLLAGLAVHEEADIRRYAVRRLLEILKWEYRRAKDVAEALRSVDLDRDDPEAVRLIAETERLCSGR